MRVVPPDGAEHGILSRGHDRNTTSNKYFLDTSTPGLRESGAWFSRRRRRRPYAEGGLVA